MRTRNYNRETKDIAKSMYLRGDSFREIAKALGCTHMAVSKWCREEHWASYRDRVYAESTEIAAVKAQDILSDIQTQRMLAYYKILVKGLEELPDIKVESAKEAVYLIETALKGLSLAEEAALSLQFLTQVAEVVRSEVSDKETNDRITLRFRDLWLRHYGDTLINPSGRSNPVANN